MIVTRLSNFTVRWKEALAETMNGDQRDRREAIVPSRVPPYIYL